MVTVTGALRRTLLVEWNGRPWPLPADVTILDLFTKRAATHPGRPALRRGDRVLTYGDLDAISGRLAGVLAGRGVARGDFVPLVMADGLELPVGMVALMKRAAPFVPVDATWPPDRIEAILANLSPAVVLCTAATAHLAGPRPVAVDLDALSTGGAPPAPARPVQDDLVYGFYTSGSTGTPKCALNVHRGLLNRFLYMTRRYGDGGSHVVLQNSRHVFDSSIWQLLWPLTAGSEVVIPERDGILDLTETIECIGRHGVTMTDFVPSIFNTLVELVESDRRLAGKLTSLRHLLVGGEEIQPRAVHRFRALLEGVGVTNTYGPTEASIGSVFHEVADADGDDIPLGRPIDNTYAVVLDERRELVPPGEIGHIHIGGECLGRGYLGDEERTRAAFVDNPFPEIPGALLYRTGDLGFVGDDGCLRYAGRVDDQVKVGGVRIELGEVETALRDHAAVRDARVVAAGPAGDKRLVGFVALRRPASPAELRAHAAARLPAASVPARVVVLGELPLTPNGKADRRALQRLAEGTTPAGEDGTAAAALSGTELAVRELWLGLLHRTDVDPDENFFAQGGDSLDAQRLALALERRFGVQVGLRAVLEAPTVRAQAALVTTGRVPAPAAPDVDADTQLPEGIVPASAEAAGAPQHVLLTGATGFIGAHLLYDLLATTDLAVTCLVRAASPAAADARLRESLRRYHLHPPGRHRRLRILTGDLSRPMFGWDRERFDEVAAGVDTVLHAGAVVNLLLGYDALREANVRGTAEVLRLAARGRGTRVHHLSSLSILPDRPVPAPETLPPPAPLPHDGYSRTKWVAERLVATGRARGIPAITYRLGEVAPHSGTGLGNPDWAVARIVEACIRTGLRLRSSVTLDWTPVDEVSRLVVTAAAVGRTEPGIVHVLRPDPVALDTVLDRVPATARLPEASYEAFYRALSTRARQPADSGHLARLLPLLPEPAGARATQAPAREGLATLFRNETARCAREGAESLRRDLGVRWDRDRDLVLVAFAAAVASDDRTGLRRTVA